MYIIDAVMMPNKNDIIAGREPTHGQNMPTVNSPSTGPATIPFTLIAACNTVPVKLFATYAEIIAPMPDIKTITRDET